MTLAALISASIVLAAVVIPAARSFRSDLRAPANSFWLMAVIAVGWLCLAALTGGNNPLNALIFGVVMFLPLEVLALIAALLLNGFVTLRREGRSLTNLLSLLAGLGLIALTVFGVVALLTSQLSPWPMVATVLLVMLTGWTGFLFTSYLVYSFLYPRLWKRPKPDFVVVHGSGLVKGRVAKLLGSRIDEGIARWRAAGGDIPLILSGGKGPDEPRSEASAMAEYAAEKGVPASVLVLEDRSGTTRENLEFTKRIVVDRLGPDAAGIAVTSDYHVLRTAALARDVGIDVHVAPARTALYYRVNAFMREVVAMVNRNRVKHLAAAAIVCLPLPILIALSQLSGF